MASWNDGWLVRLLVVICPLQFRQINIKELSSSESSFSILILYVSTHLEKKMSIGYRRHRMLWNIAFFCEMVFGSFRQHFTDENCNVFKNLLTKCFQEPPNPIAMCPISTRRNKPGIDHYWAWSHLPAIPWGKFDRFHPPAVEHNDSLELVVLQLVVVGQAIFYISKRELRKISR